MQRKKVLFLASWYPSKEHPTLGNFIQKHAEVAATIADVDVLYAVSTDKVNETTIEKFIENGVNTVIVYYPKVKSKLPIYASFLKRNAYIRAMKEGCQAHNKHYDLVHLNEIYPAGFFALKLKKHLGLPYIITTHWSGFLDNGEGFKKLPIWTKKQYKQIFNEAKNLLTVSDTLGKAIQKLKLFTHYEILPNVVDASIFYPASQSEEENKVKRFIHISTFDAPVKNTENMIKAFSQLKSDYSLHIITENEEKDVWKVLDKWSIPKEKCIVESKLDTKQIAELIRQSDALVLFSLKETFSVVIAEAWMSGIPVIASKCGGLTDEITPELGISVPINSISELTFALENFQSTNYDAIAIRTKATSFSKQEIANQLKQIYSTN
jgi:glycosyltransferase involved in cell wall biosynthesis